eukprot:Gb_35695 [translate_table: standard]
MVEEDVSKEGSFSNHYIDMIMHLAELILTEHYVEFNNVCYKQIQGTTMGSNFVVVYACLFLCHLERKVAEKINLKNLNFFKRNSHHKMLPKRIECLSVHSILILASSPSKGVFHRVTLNPKLLELLQKDPALRHIMKPLICWRNPKKLGSVLTRCKFSLDNLKTASTSEERRKEKITRPSKGLSGEDSFLNP